MSHHPLTRYTQAVYEDAHRLATHVEAAVIALRDAMGGYPARTPGAAPDTHVRIVDADESEHGRVELTTVERLADHPDQAARALAQLEEHIRLAHHQVAVAAAIALKWAIPVIDDTTVQRRLKNAVTADGGIWCRNCARHGHKEPREQGKTECRFCAGFRRTYGLDAPKAVLDVRDARGGRLFVQDIERILDRDQPGWRKKAPKGKKR